MIFDGIDPRMAMSLTVNWILFLALFPMAFIWLRRAYRIIIKKNYSEVAQKKGMPPKNPKKWAPFVALINLAAGCSCIFTIVVVLLALAPYSTWSAIAGTTIWLKIFADFILRSQAHPFKFGKNKEQETCAS